MGKLFCTVILLLNIIACNSKKVEKILWQGELVYNTADINYLYWNDGNQFMAQEKDSIMVSFAGFEFDNSVYILVSMGSNKSQPLTFFTIESSLSYEFEKEEIKLKPIKPKNLDKTHFSFFNTVIDGAGRISRLFLNIPVDILLGAGKVESDNTQDKIGGEYHDEANNMTKKLFADNHTLFPGTKYAGFLVFEYDPDKNIKKNDFILDIKVGTDFIAEGGFAK